MGSNYSLQKPRWLRHLTFLLPRSSLASMLGLSLNLQPNLWMDHTISHNYFGIQMASLLHSPKEWLYSWRQTTFRTTAIFCWLPLHNRPLAGLDTLAFTISLQLSIGLYPSPMVHPRCFNNSPTATKLYTYLISTINGTFCHLGICHITDLWDRPHKQWKDFSHQISHLINLSPDTGQSLRKALSILTSAKGIASPMQNPWEH